MRRSWVGVGALVSVGALFVQLAGAAPVKEEDRCTILKLKAVVKELKDKAQCYERSVKGGVPVLQACMQRAEEKRERLFTRAEEAGHCKTTKDGETVSRRIDTFLRDVALSLQGWSAASPSATPAGKAEAPAATGSGAAPAPATAPTASPTGAPTASPKE